MMSRVSPSIHLEEAHVKRAEISVRRRQIMIAGAVSAATPAGVLAAQGADPAELTQPAVLASFVRSGDKLIVSGRVVDAERNAIAGALVETSHDAVTTTTDADGRFMLMTSAGRRGRSGTLVIRAPDPSSPARAASVPENARHDPQRDEHDVWRTTVAVVLA
jgi:hypothetical protein